MSTMGIPGIADSADPPRHRQAALLLGLLATALFGAPLVDPTDLRNLTPEEGTAILGPQGGDEIASSLAGAGDWNQDGRPDLIIGSSFARHPDSGQRTGLAHIVFGTGSPPASVDLAALGASGTVVVGAAVGDQAGAAVAGIGDWNDDGIDDVAVGAPFAQPGGLTEIGRVCVLFGRSSPPTRIDLTSFTASDGVVITGAALGDQTGFALAPAGDWNADGLPDFAIGAPNADFGAIDAGRAYVLFGTGSPPASLELSALEPSAGTIIDGANDSGGVPIINLFGDSAGFALAGGSDLTGDGIDDMLVNAPAADPGVPNAGITYLIEGSVSPEAVIDLATPPASVHTLSGIAQDDQAFLVTIGGFNPFFGGNVASPGDMTGDGLGDLAVASQFADPTGDLAGEVYLRRGRTPFPSSLPLTSLAPGDVTLRGAAAGDLTGRGLAGAGDLNGDGFADLAIGAPQANPLGRSDAGTVTVWFGSPLWSGILTLPDTDVFGLRFLGEQSDDFAGLSVAGIGDWNDDGVDDLAIGSPGGGGTRGRSDAGVVHIVFGGAFQVPVTAVGDWTIYR